MHPPWARVAHKGVPVIQVAVRGERIGRRVPVAVPLVGTVTDTIEALLPLITAETDRRGGRQVLALATLWGQL